MSDEDEEHEDDDEETEEEAREREEEEDRERHGCLESKARAAVVGSLWYPCDDEMTVIVFVDAFPADGGHGWARALCLTGSWHGYVDGGEVFDVCFDDFELLEEFDVDFHGRQAA